MADTMTRGLSRPGLSLLAGGMVRFHCRMSRKTRRMVKTTLLGVAATALTVKGALASPLGVVAEGPLDKLKQNADEKKEQALTQSPNALDQAGARLVASIAPLPTGSPSPSPLEDANHVKRSKSDQAPDVCPGT